MAAILALGDGAAVSHRSAAALWGMIHAHAGPIEVTVPSDGGREKRRGIKVHRSATLIAEFTSFCNGIQVTKPKRTLRDLHRISSQPDYRRAVRRALDLRLIDSSDLKSDDDFTRSELERLFRKLCRRHRLPQPDVNAHVGPYEVDFLWREQSVIVETDSWRHHSDRSAFERDRARDAHMQTLGFRVLRFTYRQVRDDGAGIAASLRAVFGAGAAT
jgi:very-short-patch-repair endonuclease